MLVPRLRRVWFHRTWTDWRFQWIQPFKDFNGRIGRVLLAALLFKLGLPHHVVTAQTEPLQRRDYLDALHAADRGELGLLAQLWLQRLAKVHPIG